MKARRFYGFGDMRMQCGGVVVAPGDWLVGDDAGVVVAPAARLEQAIETAGRILPAEREIARQIRAGREIGEILRCDEVLERKAASDFLPQLRAVEKRRP